MLPGFRFLLAAIVLSVSIVTFGLGAAALLRAAHEEFASIPARRATPEPYFAQASEPSAPTLAMLRVEPAPPDNGPVISPPAPAVAEEPAPEAVPVPNVETQQLAALSTDVAPPEEPAKPELAAIEPPVAAPSTQESPAETKVAVLDATPPPAPVLETAPPPAPAIDTAVPPAELIVPPAMTDGSNAVAATKPATRTAALTRPAASVETEAEAKKAAAKAERAELRKKERAERAKERRRLAARRARLAAQQAAATQAAAVQQAADPFAATPAPTTTTIKRRR